MDGFLSDADDYEIPGFAESAFQIAAEEAEEEDHEEEGEGHEEEHEEEAFGVLEGSRVERRGGAIGLSAVGENGFAGTVDGTDAIVSILLGSEEGIVYVCNGDEDISEWYYGPVPNLNDISFTNPQGARITASLIGNSFKGKITLRDGREL